MTYAHHLLAEVEQVAHQDKRKRDDRASPAEPKVKRFEEAKGDGKSGGKDRASGGHPCRFFLSDGGCKKGKACSWPHVMDDQKRCWTCGSTQHFSPACDRPREAGKEPGTHLGEKGGKGADGKGGKPTVKQIWKDEASTEEMPCRPEAGEEAPPSETVKGLLEEANRMLKTLAGARGPEESGCEKGDKLAAMQKQLDKLRKMKALRLSRISGEEERYGLLDSGATHPMRGIKDGEDVTAYERVKVTLANNRGRWR